jgi:hypothetical protein
MAAVNRERLGELMKMCRECELDVAGVEAASLSAWRAWSGTGLQVRLVRSAGHDLVLAGVDAKLLFCRIVEAPIASSELRATITRAAALLGAEGFRALSASGLDDESRNSIASDLGIEVKDPAHAVDDAVAAGLATAGSVLTDFTPPEERVLREKRRVRKVGMTMAAASGVLVLCAGLLATQRISVLHGKKSELENQQKLVAAEKQELDQLNAELQHAKANETLIVAARPGHRMSTLFSLIGARTTDLMSIDVLKVEDQEDLSGRPSGSAAPAGPMPHLLEVRINGVARNGTAVRAFADSLLASNAFADVRVEASERVLLGVGMDGERFRIYARAETH